MRSLLDIMSLPEEAYSPVGWSKCGGCAYNDYCMSRAKDNQDVVLVYDLDQNLARRLREMGVFTIQELVSKYDEDSLSARNSTAGPLPRERFSICMRRPAPIRNIPLEHV
jgi:predicted RecB family nuclease